jgi:hypothetical protein
MKSPFEPCRWNSSAEFGHSMSCLGLVVLALSMPECLYADVKITAVVGVTTSADDNGGEGNMNKNIKVFMAGVYPMQVSEWTKTN